jgi:WD40 repeat protein
LDELRPPSDGHADEAAETFTGRGWVLDRLDSFLAGPDRAFLLTGGPGTGKSAIAAHLVEISAGTVPAPGDAALGPGFLFHAHLCRANDPNRIRPSRLVEILSSHLGSAFEPCQEAIRAFAGAGGTNVSVTVQAGTAADGARVVGIGTLNITVGQELPSTDAFMDLVARPLWELERSGDHRRIVILVDGLDEALAYAPETESRTIPGLLGTILRAPDALPPTVRFIFTSRPDTRVLGALGMSSDLDLITDAPPDVDDVGDYAKARFEGSPVLAAKAGTLAGMVGRAGAGNFLYAYHVVKDLLDHPDRAEDLDALELPEDLEAVYRRFLERELTRDRASWEDRYRPVLGALVVARGDGLTVDQLLGTVGLNRTQLAGPLRASAQYLAGPEPGGPYRIYHQSFREFLLEDPNYRVDPQEANQTLANYLVDEHGGSWASCDDPYALGHTPTHLTEAIRDAPSRRSREDLEERLSKVLTDLGFLEQKTAMLGIDAVLTDFHAANEAVGLRAPLSQTLRVLSREAANLRGWDAVSSPAFFVQQVAIRAFELGHDPLVRAAAARLDAGEGPHLRLRWYRGLRAAALVRTLSGHQGSIGALAISPDGWRVVTGSVDRTTCVWDLMTGRRVHVLAGQAQVTQVAITPDGELALSASTGGVIDVWDLRSGERVHSIEAHEDVVSALACLPDSWRVVSAAWSMDRTLKVWDLRTGTCLQTLPTPSGIRDIAILGEGEHIVTAATDRRLHLWDLGAGRLVREIAGYQASERIAAVPGSNRIVFATPDGRPDLFVLDVLGGAVRRLPPGHSREVRAIAVSQDGRVAVTGSEDGTLRAWDLEDGSEVRQLGDRTYWVTAVGLTQDRGHALSASLDNTVKVWDLSVPPEQHPEGIHEDSVQGIAVSPDGGYVLSAADNRVMKQWSMRDGALTRTEVHGGPSRALAACAARPWAVSFYRDSVLKLWDLDDGTVLQTLEGDHSSVHDLAVSARGERAISGNDDGTVTVWDLATGRIELRSKDVAGGVRAVAIAGDGRRAVSATIKGVAVVWDLDEGRMHRRYPMHEGFITGVALLPGERAALSASHDGTLRCWDLESGEARAVRRGLGAMTAVLPTSDGRAAIVTSDNPYISVFELAAGRELAKVALPRVPFSVALSGDDRSLVAGDMGGGIWCFELSARGGTGPPRPQPKE